MAVIALVGITTFSLLRQSLDREADRALAERAAVARASWSDLFTSAWPPATPQPVAGDDDGENDDSTREGEADGNGGDDEAHELVESGDILLFAVDANGHLLANARGLSVRGSLTQPA